MFPSGARKATSIRSARGELCVRPNATNETPKRPRALAGLASRRIGSSVAGKRAVWLLPEGSHDLAYAPALGRALRTLAPYADIVHIHSLVPYPTYAAFRAVRRFDEPYVVSPNGALDPWIRKRGRRACRRSSA